jgi:hypothetical protein
VEGSTNSVEDRGQRERGSGGCSPLVSSSAKFVNECNLYSYWFITDVFSTELGIGLSFVRTSELISGWGVKRPPTPLATPLDYNNFIKLQPDFSASEPPLELGT